MTLPRITKKWKMMATPSDLPKAVGAWRFRPVRVAGITRIPFVQDNEVDRRRIDGRVISTDHDKENNDNDRAD